MPRTELNGLLLISQMLCMDTQWFLYMIPLVLIPLVMFWLTLAFPLVIALLLLSPHSPKRKLIRI